MRIDQGEKKCVARGSIQSGAQIDINPADPDVIEPNQACSSGFIYTKDNGEDPATYHCMKDRTSVESPVGRAMKVGEDCDYFEYTDINNPDQGAIAGSKPAQCGINSDSWAWCPQHKGDDQYRKYLGTMNTLLNGKRATCNVHSFGPLFCPELTERTTFSALNEKKRAEWVTGTDQGYALVARNSYCIEDAFTYTYWQNDLGMAIFAGVLSITLMLF